MRIGCIQVLYNPKLNILERSIKNIVEQVDVLVIVDNSPNKTCINLITNSSKVVYIFNNKNLGIAEAQNIGINELNKKSIDYIYFSDQDSIPPSNIIQILIQDYKNLIKQNILVGAIGPTIINRQTNKAYKGRIKRGVPISSSINEVSEIISSGSLISTETLQKIGYMDSKLFIDGVDHEWCWRAHYMNGYRFFITKNTELNHQLGEGDRSFMGIRIAIATPFRAYYQYRNYFILAKRKYVPTYWKVSNGLKYIIRLIYYPLFVKPRIKYLKNSLRGIKDGLLNQI